MKKINKKETCSVCHGRKKLNTCIGYQFMELDCWRCGGTGKINTNKK